MSSSAHPVKPLKQLRQGKVIGEAQVWLTGMGLSVALILAAVLLGVIIFNGFAVFWPKTVTELTIVEGNKTTLIAGEVIKIQQRAAPEPGQPQIADMLLYTGNKEVLKSSFRFIDMKLITAQRQPSDIVKIERQEYGNAIGFPVSLSIKMADKKIETVRAEDQRFSSELKRLIDEANSRWAVIRILEKGRIGDNAKAIQALERKRKELVNPVRQTPQAQIQLVDEAISERKAEYQALAKQAAALRAMQLENKLTLRLVSGESKDISTGKIVGVYWPNRLGFFDRLSHFFAKMWDFVSGTPREANTEGGIFPAIFGTFVMTLLMSIAVVPVGVLAAIYLREYAKQGPLVRGVRIAVNNLAGVPSIVFGVFGLGFFVYIMGGSLDDLFFHDKMPTPTFGTGGIMWAAATLALMTVPVVIVATEESIASVPRGMKEASLALGASKWQTIRGIVLPASVTGILTGTILAMARGAGEVAPLMLVGVVKLAPTLPINGEYPFVHLDQKFMHLGFHIFDLAFQSPDSEAARPAVFATTFVLILLVLIMNLSAILLRENLRRKFKTAAF